MPRPATPLTLLDDNRSDLALEATESAAFTLAITLFGFPVDPFESTNTPVVISGRVLEQPEIHNIYLDDD